MIKKVYVVQVHEYDYFTGGKDTYKTFDTLKEALKYKKKETYFIESDHYSKASLYSPEWVWELDKSARAHKPLQVWLNEHHFTNYDLPF